MKFVQNVTTKHLELKAEILTVNGWTPISFRLAPGSHYLIEEALRYHDLEELINSGSLKVVSEDSTLQTPPEAPTLQTSLEDSETVEPDIHTEETPENTEPDSVDSVEQEISEPDLEEISEPVNLGDSDEFACPHCGATYATQRGLTRHLNSEHPSE